jgi:DNA polymerase/3'-5' exonuclease PolX
MPLLYNEALRHAEGLAALLRPVCERVLIAGSIRREKPIVKDIEIVVLLRQDGGLFCETPNIDMLESQLLSMVRGCILAYDTEVQRDGAKHKRFLVREAGNTVLDLFIVHDPRSWGNIATIRTGPSPFSMLLMTPRDQWLPDIVEGETVHRQGCMPVGTRQKEGYLVRGETVIPCPEEQDFFDALGLPWIEPKDRTPEKLAEVRS